MHGTPPGGRDGAGGRGATGPLRPVWNALLPAVGWIGGHVRGLYAAVGLFLVLGLTLAIVLAGTFALLAEGVAGGFTQSVDDAVVTWARGRTAAWLDWIAVAGAVLGSGAAMWAVLAVGTAVLLRMRQRSSALLLWVSLLGARFLNAELKVLFDRPRPRPIDWDLQVLGRPIEFPTSSSFPSGHAVTSVVIYGTLAYLILRLQPAAHLRWLTLALAALLIFLIGLSRIYLGVHYPSDVLAGYLAGFVWATTAAFAVEVMRYFATSLRNDERTR